MTTGQLTNYGASQIMNFIFGGVPMTLPAMWYAAYCVGTSSAASPGAEPGGGGYERKAIANTVAEWPTSTQQMQTNANDIIWKSATANHGLVQSVVLYDSPINGNAWCYFPLPAPKTVEAGDAMRIPAGSLTVALNTGLFSNLIKNQLLNNLFGGVPMNTIPSLYFGYTTSASTDLTAGVEPSANGYNRVQVSNNTGMFPPAATGNKTNALDITFPEATGAQGTAVGLAIFSAPTGGSYIGYVPTPNRIVDVGITPRVPSGLLDLTLS